MIRSLQFIGFIEPAKRGMTRPLIIQAKGADVMPADSSTQSLPAAACASLPWR